MVFFWTAAAAQVAAKRERLKAAEARLLELAQQKHQATANHVKVRVTDTRIPAAVVPIATTAAAATTTTSCMGSTTAVAQQEGEQELETAASYNIHGIEVTNDSPFSDLEKERPLVLLHGYMNGGAYFYRNLMGLSMHFAKIHALDLLGWGLSSRPNFSSSSLVAGKKCSIQTTEDFFVESLEAWRKQQDIDSMVLAGHSMGGYLSVAYSERYPQHVHRLILISPAGVPEETAEDIQRREKRYLSSYRSRMFYSLYRSLFRRGYTGGDLLRSLSEKRGRSWIEQYVTRRLPAINQPAEQEALTDYLYHNNTLPGSGEYCLPKLLKPSVFGKKPLQHRIPNLDVSSVSFLYGESDWMSATGGLLVEQECAKRRQQGSGDTTTSSSTTTPDIAVYQVSNAGHLLMLENSQEFNNGLLLAAGLLPSSASVRLLTPSGDAMIPKRLLAFEPQAAVDDEATVSKDNLRAKNRYPPATQVAA